MRLFGTFGPGTAAHQRAAVQARWVETENGVTVAVQGGPIRLGSTPAASPANAILKAYAARGPRFLDELTGRFALAVVDANRSSVLLALDPMGMENLAYAVHGSALAFGSSATAVAEAGGQAPRLRAQALYDYLLLHMVPAPDTAFEGVHKLRPGTCVRFEAGRLTVERYWIPRFPRGGRADFAALRDELHDSLHQAVAACSPDERTGAFLSGGLDSSSVAGMLGKVSGKAPRTFSIGFGVDEFNELEYAHVANRRFGAIPHEYQVVPEDIVEAFGRIAAAYDEPFGNSSAIPTYCCARLAASHGVTHLLAGDGGDELFGGNERYVRQRVFEAYARFLPGTLRRGLVEPLTRLIDPDSRITPLRKLRSYVDQARIPLPERLETWNYMYREDLGAMLEPEFRAAVDTRSPIERMSEVYAAAPSDAMLHRMLFYDWHYTLSDNDLRKVGTTCELAGVKVSYPMLDPRVVELSLRVPEGMMIEGLELRSFYKRAMKGFLPDEILTKSKHGFGLPFGVWLKTHAALGEFVYGLLGALKSRRIVKPAFIDRLVDEHRTGHPGYYGYAIWDLAMLEAWLQAHPGIRPPQLASR